MPYYEVSRHVLVDQVVTIEAESKEKARQKAVDPINGEVQFDKGVDVTVVEYVKGKEDF